VELGVAFGAHAHQRPGDAHRAEHESVVVPAHDHGHGLDAGFGLLDGQRVAARPGRRQLREKTVEIAQRAWPAPRGIGDTQPVGQREPAGCGIVEVPFDTPLTVEWGDLGSATVTLGHQ